MMYENKTSRPTPSGGYKPSSQSAGGTPSAAHTTGYQGRVSGLGGKEGSSYSISTGGGSSSYGISRSGGSSRLGAGSMNSNGYSNSTSQRGISSNNTNNYGSRASPNSAQPAGSSPLGGGAYSLSPREDHGSPSGYSPPPVPQFSSPLSAVGSANRQLLQQKKSSAASLPPSSRQQPQQQPYTGISAALPPAKSQYSPERSTSARYASTRTATTAAGAPTRKPVIDSGCTILEHERRPSASTATQPAQRAVVRSYAIGVKLGQGAFATVYEVTDKASGEIFAAKIVDKAKLTDDKKRQKMFMEIKIHEKLRHIHVLQFIRQFQDEFYHYLILERCLGSSLMEMSRQRAVFSVPETQFIMIQLLDALSYLHDQNVIHRDLKLANVIVDEHLNMKVGDFGLATELAYNGQRKWTKCGTPNYIAPEVLAESEGYDFACDIWSLGVLLYTLLVGIPPFETQTLNHTYTRIQQGRFSFPVSSNIPTSAKQLISRMLQCQPDKRPSFVDIRLSSFFKDAPRVAPQTLLEVLPQDDFEIAKRAIARRREREQLAEQQQQQQQQQQQSHLGRRDSQRSRSSSGRSSGHQHHPAADAEFEGDEAAVFEAGSTPYQKSSVPVFRPSSRDAARTRHADPASYQQQHSRLSGGDSSPLLIPTLDGGDSLPRPPVPVEPRKVPVQVLKPENPNEQRFAPYFPNRPGDDSSPVGLGPTSSSPAPGPRMDYPVPTPQRQQQQQQQRLSPKAMSSQSPYSPSPTNRCPEQFPGVWVTRVLDYTRKYGVSCELNDGSLSAVFNDRTKLLWRLTNGSVAYHCRHTKNGSIQTDVLHDAFAVDSHGEPTMAGSSASTNNSPVGGGSSAPQERQTAKKMTLSKYFRSCFDSTSIKERVMLLDMFPTPNSPPRATASLVKPTLGSAAATGVYVKSITSLCALPGSPSIGEPVRFEVVSASCVLPSSSRDSPGGQYACVVFRFSDGSAQVLWEPTSFCETSGEFKLVEQAQPLSAQSNAACRLQCCLALRGCGATVILSPDALAHYPDRMSERATSSATPVSATGSSASPMMLGERGDGAPSPFMQGGGGMAAVSPAFPLTLCGDGHPAEPSSVPTVASSLETAHQECGFPRSSWSRSSNSPNAVHGSKGNDFPTGGGLQASALVVDLACGGALESEGVLIGALVQVSQAAVHATNPGSLAAAAGVL